MTFDCPHCGVRLQVPDTLAGKKVRCSDCKSVLDVPGEVVPVSLLRPGPPPPPPPPVPSPRERRRSPRREDEPATNWGMIIALGGAGLFLAMLLCLGGFAFVLLMSPAAAPGPGPGPIARPRPMDERPPWEGPPPEAVRMPVPPPVEEPAPVVRAASRPVAFTDGRFTTRLTFDEKDFPGPGHELVYPLVIDARAEAVYRVETKDNPRILVKVEGPDGPVNPPPDPFGRNRPVAAFHAAGAGKYTVSVSCARWEKGGCEVTIRELGDGDALPPNLQLPPPSKELPTLAVSQSLGQPHDKRLTTAAFAPDGSSFYLAHADGTLTYWSHPELEQKGGYDTKLTIAVLGVDGAGRVYAQTRKHDRFPRLGERAIGPLLVWEPLRPARDGQAFPAARWTLMLNGSVPRLLPSKDGKWMYALDVHNRKLLRVGGAAPKVETELELGPGVASFCLTPDGKTLYACSTSNRIDVIDAATFKLLRSVRFTSGQPTDIAATNEGMCYLAGRGGSDPFGEYGLVVDVGRTKGDRADTAALGIRCHTRFALMLPDQRAVLLSGDRRLNVCTVTKRPTVFRTVHKESNYDGYNIPAQAWVSPDGRTLLYDRGQILSVSR